MLPARPTHRFRHAFPEFRYPAQAVRRCRFVRIVCCQLNRLNGGIDFPYSLAKVSFSDRPRPQQHNARPTVPDHFQASFGFGRGHDFDTRLRQNTRKIITTLLLVVNDEQRYRIAAARRCCLPALLHNSWRIRSTPTSSGGGRTTECLHVCGFFTFRNSGRPLQTQKSIKDPSTCSAESLPGGQQPTNRRCTPLGPPPNPPLSEQPSTVQLQSA